MTACKFMHPNPGGGGGGGRGEGKGRGDDRGVWRV